MEFPVLIHKLKDSALYFFNEKDFGLVSTDGESFYDNGTVYDSKGDVYKIVGVKNKKKSSFLQSLKYFQQMYIAKVEYVENGKISLLDFKTVIISHIKLHKRYWESRSTIDDLIKSIMEKENIKEIICFLE